MAYRKLNDIDFNGKKAILRVDFNVPLDDQGRITDDYRIKIALPTINKILESNAQKLIIITHVGRPKNNEDHLKTDNLARHTSKLLGKPVAKVDDWGEGGLPPQQVVFLENIRFNKAEKSKDESERDEFGKKLASLADVFVNDAFANLHRAHASMTSIPKFIPGCVGLRVQEELQTFEKALANPKRPLAAIIGGLKADKLQAIANLLDKVDVMQVAGALAFTLLKAKGYEMGDSKIDSEGLESMKDLAEKILASSKVRLPEDAVVADAFSNDANSKTVPVECIDPGWMALDIGAKSAEKFASELESAGTILWFGPIGVFEMQKFAQGTKKIGSCMAQSSATTIVGGGDSAAAVAKLGLFEKISLVSSGGGASLAIIEGKTLPAISALEKNSEEFH